MFLREEGFDLVPVAIVEVCFDVEFGVDEAQLTVRLEDKANQRRKALH